MSAGCSLYLFLFFLISAGTGKHRKWSRQRRCAAHSNNRWWREKRRRPVRERMWDFTVRKSELCTVWNRQVQQSGRAGPGCEMDDNEEWWMAVRERLSLKDALFIGMKWYQKLRVRWRLADKSDIKQTWQIQIWREVGGEATAARTCSRRSAWDLVAKKGKKAYWEALMSMILYSVLWVQWCANGLTLRDKKYVKQQWECQ